MLIVTPWRVQRVQFIWGKTLVPVTGEILKGFFPMKPIQGTDKAGTADGCWRITLCAAATTNQILNPMLLQSAGII